VLASHINGERNRVHPHFLRSTVYCGACGERLIVTCAKSHTGIKYPYSVCAGRHGKRCDCQQRAVLIEDVERLVEDEYAKLSFTLEQRQKLESWALAEIQKASADIAAERREMEIEKDKLERKQKKLLEAYYADSLPLKLIKNEQVTKVVTRKLGHYCRLNIENTWPFQMHTEENMLQ
jgi:hypothetical protein